MNERIEELAKQLDFPIGLTDPQWAYEEKLNTFAELLIKDCAAYVKRQCMQPSRFTAADLLERYGIKDE